MYLRYDYGIYLLPQIYTQNIPKIQRPHRYGRTVRGHSMNFQMFSEISFSLQRTVTVRTHRNLKALAQVTECSHTKKYEKV